MCDQRSMFSFEKNKESQNLPEGSERKQIGIIKYKDPPSDDHGLVSKSTKDDSLINIKDNTIFDYLVFYAGHKDNKANPGATTGYMNGNIFESGSKSSTIIHIKNNKKLCQMMGDDKYIPCKGIESYFRMLWTKYGIVKKVTDPDGNADIEKHGYYEKTIWENGNVGPEIDKDDFKYDNMDIKKTYYNAMDIWSQFYLKFMFGNDIKKEHFYHCLPDELNTVPDKQIQETKADTILSSINKAYDHIYTEEYNKDNGLYLDIKPSENNSPFPYHADYNPPKDGGIDKIHIVSEMKPKITLPIFQDDTHFTGSISNRLPENLFQVYIIHREH